MGATPQESDPGKEQNQVQTPQRNKYKTHQGQNNFIKIKQKQRAHQPCGKHPGSCLTKERDLPNDQTYMREVLVGSRSPGLSPTPLLHNGEPGPIRRAMHNNKKASTLKIPIPRRKSRRVSCSEEQSHFYFYFCFISPGLLNHAQHHFRYVRHHRAPFLDNACIPRPPIAPVSLSFKPINLRLASMSHVTPI